MSKKRNKTGAGPRESKDRRELPDYRDEKQLEAMIRNTFSDAREHLRRLEDRHPDMIAKVELDPKHMKRRVNAAAAYAGRVREQVQNICPDVPELFYIEEEWATINSLPIAVYETLECSSYLILGAAIWMLDHIKQNGKIHEAVKLLPGDDEHIDEAVSIPTLYDPVHGNNVIASMVYAIEQRNSDCVQPGQGRSKRKASATAAAKCFTDDFTTAGTHRQDVPSRRRFEGLLALLRPEDIQQAVSQFEDAVFSWTGCYFRCRRIYCKREAELNDRRTRFFAALGETAKDILHLRRKGTPGFPFGISTPQDSPLSAVLPPLPGNSLDKYMSSPSRVLDYIDQVDSFDEESLTLTNEINKMAFKSYRLGTAPRARVERDFGTEIADIVSEFSISDPYVMCFALLYLLDTGSDLPWLYFPGIAVMEYAGAMLPWANADYDELDDPHWAQYYDPESGECPLPVKNPPELADWYRLDYRSNTSDPNAQFRTNLAQIVYEITGGIMPRDMHRYDDTLRHLRHYGVTGKKTQLPLLYCMLLLGEGMHRSEDWRIDYGFPEQEQEPEESWSPEEEVRQESAGQELLIEQIAALKRENEMLRRTAHDAERGGRELRKQYDELVRRAQREHKELSELREILFCRENDLEPELEDDASDVAFPYTVRRTTVIFGGHDTWAKAIRPMLAGDIRFIDRDMRPDANLIRHAGAVWIQPNSLSHANFYKIINIIRTHGIALHYFKYVSAEKCAVQLALEDMKMPL